MQDFNFYHQQQGLEFGGKLQGSGFRLSGFRVLICSFGGCQCSLILGLGGVGGLVLFLWVGG